MLRPPCSLHVVDSSVVYMVAGQVVQLEQSLRAVLEEDLAEAAVVVVRV